MQVSSHLGIPNILPRQVHLRILRKLYAAAIGGGLWKTYDGGKSWNLLTDDSTTLAVSILHF